MIHFHEIKEPLSIEATCENCGEVDTYYLPTEREISLMEDIVALQERNEKLMEAVRSLAEDNFVPSPIETTGLIGVIRYDESWYTLSESELKTLQESLLLKEKQNDIILFSASS